MRPYVGVSELAYEEGAPASKSHQNTPPPAAHMTLPLGFGPLPSRPLNSWGGGGHCRTLPHTAAHTASECRPLPLRRPLTHCCRTLPRYHTLPDCWSYAYCRVHSARQPHTAARTATHCRVHYRTLPRALPHTAAHTTAPCCTTASCRTAAH
jgi:hypothetical protein